MVLSCKPQHKTRFYLLLVPSHFSPLPGIFKTCILKELIFVPRLKDNSIFWQLESWCFYLLKIAHLKQNNRLDYARGEITYFLNKHLCGFFFSAWWRLIYNDIFWSRIQPQHSYWEQQAQRQSLYSGERTRYFTQDLRTLGTFILC